MDSPIGNNLTRAKLQQLLATVGSQTIDDTAVEAEDYNWNQPHYFDSVQLKKLQNFSEKLAKLLSDKFSEFFSSRFNVTIASAQQHFSEDFLTPLEAQRQSDYYLPLVHEDGRSYGAIGIPAKTAIAWTMQLLGEEASQEDDNKELSELEESLLVDIATVFVKVFSESYSDDSFHPDDKITKEVLPLELNGDEELYKINFSIENVQSQSESNEEQPNIFEAYFLIFCEKLESIVQENMQQERQLSREEISNTILEHLQQNSVMVTCKLGSVTLTFEELMGLQVNDIVLIDRKIDEPVELLIEGKSLFLGWPAKSAGKYAVAIEQLSHDDSQNITTNP